MKHKGVYASSPEAEEALRRFLNQFALPGKRARYLDLISRPKSRRKFLNTLSHELESHLDPANRVEQLSAKQLALPGFRFDHHHDFGEPIDTLATVCTSFDEDVLIVSTDGNVGMHGPDYMDGRTFYCA